jgi:hypothetical protein
MFYLAKHTGGDRSEVISVPYLVIFRDIITHSFTVTLQHGEARSQLKIFAKIKIASDLFFAYAADALDCLHGMVQLQLVSAIAITKIIISPCCIDRQPSTTMNSPRT